MKLVSCVREKNSQKYLTRLLPQLQKISDVIVILDDHSDDGTYEWLSQYVSQHKDNIHLIQQPEMTFHGGRDWNLLYKYAAQFNPDWLFCPDADELIEEGYEQQVRDLAEESGRDIMGWSFPFYYLWNDERHYQYKGKHHNTRVIRLFRYFASMNPPDRMAHCTAVPDALDRRTLRIAPIRMWHFGYMLPEDRKAKYDFYTVRDADPLKAGSGGTNYEHLLDPGTDLAVVRPYDDWKSIPTNVGDFLDHAPFRVALGGYFPDSFVLEDFNSLSQVTVGTVDELRVSYLFDHQHIDATKGQLLVLKDYLRPGGRLEVITTDFVELCKGFVEASDQDKFSMSHRFLFTPHKKPFMTLFYKDLIYSVLNELRFQDVQHVPVPGLPARLYTIAYKPGDDKWM